MDFASKDGATLQVPAGVYTNLVTMQKNPVPPTMILVDGLNTDVTAQMQVHAQMVRMLNSVPDDVPVAIFLLGRRLRMLQGFTTDPKLLKDALQKASTVEASGLRQLDPRDDPDSLSSFQEETAAHLQARRETFPMRVTRSNASNRKPTFSPWTFVYARRLRPCAPLRVTLRDIQVGKTCFGFRRLFP